jgi:hypothetical protein
MDIHSDFNTYQFWYDPSNGLADVYINGEFIAMSRRGSSVATRMLFGSNTSAATSVSQWSEVRLETGNTIIPEPAALPSSRLQG